MSTETKVYFSDYKNDKIEKIEMGLLQDINLTVEVAEKDGDKGLNITMSDTITDNITLTGYISRDKLQTLIKMFNTIYKQGA
mgnify:CR=1 FL=1